MMFGPPRMMMSSQGLRNCDKACVIIRVAKLYCSIDKTKNTIRKHKKTIFDLLVLNAENNLWSLTYWCVLRREWMGCWGLLGWWLVKLVMTLGSFPASHGSQWIQGISNGMAEHLVLASLFIKISPRFQRKWSLMASQPWPKPHTDVSFKAHSRSSGAPSVPWPVGCRAAGGCVRPQISILLLAFVSTNKGNIVLFQKFQYWAAALTLP